jgi:hypothetical protein
MRDSWIRGCERRVALPAGLLALLVTLVAGCLLGGEAQADARSSERKVISVAPSGGDDTQRLQAALDEASTAGPGAVIELAAGTFRVGRPLIGLNFDGMIRGAGSRKTTVLADGSVNPDGLFQALPPDEAAALRVGILPPILFEFHEADIDRFGHPVTKRRSQRLVMEDLTLGASGQTVAHFDINEFATTQRLFSLVWVTGNRPDWTNSQNQTPVAIGGIDAEHAQVSTVRASFRHVHFDGRNRARADDEPGGALDPHPDVRNAFGLEGGAALVQLVPEFQLTFRPINAALRFEDSRFSDLPGQAGIFAPHLVGKHDPAWTFGRDAVEASVKVTNSTFEDMPFGTTLPNMSDVSVTLESSEYRDSDEVGLVVATNDRFTAPDAIGYPAFAPSRVTIRNSTFEDSDIAAVAVNERPGPSLVDLRIRDNDFVLDGPSQTGIIGATVDGARIVDNHFAGKGYGAVVAATSTRWRIRNNDFCDLFIPPSAPPPVDDLILPPNDAQTPIVTVNSVDIRATNNDCA